MESVLVDIQRMVLTWLKTSQADDDFVAVLADALEDAGYSDLSSRVRSDTGLWRTGLDILSVLPVRLGRKKLSGWLAEQIACQAESLYQARQARFEHPEGDFDKRGRWEPSQREDGDDIMGHVRPPSVRWPYSYMFRARTLRHCRHLVVRGVLGADVPLDARVRTKVVHQKLVELLS